MPRARNEQPAEFRVPTGEEDRVRVRRVGIIAAIGFGLGVAWPALAGKSLAPTAPGAEAQVISSAAAPSPAESPPPPAAKTALREEGAETTTAQVVEIGKVVVTSCRNSKGQRLRECDEIDLDDSAKARIAALANCKAANGVSGMLSLGLELDFRSNKVAKVMRGQSTTLDEAVAKDLVECAKKEFASASLSGIEHRHAEYTVFYAATFVPPGEVRKTADAGAKDTAASGLATVSWDVALIRDDPEEGNIVARLLHGTRVSVKARRGDWYKISFDAKGSEGWVYRAAIGL